MVHLLELEAIEPCHDPRVAHYMDPANMPFDAKRMIYGGFEMMIDL